jgi:hypothetical protein
MDGFCDEQCGKNREVVAAFHRSEIMLKNKKGRLKNTVQTASL